MFKFGYAAGHADAFLQANKRERKLKDYINQLETSLRSAPMPYRESILGDDWDNVYDKWWHEHASEEALAARPKKCECSRCSEYAEYEGYCFKCYANIDGVCD